MLVRHIIEDLESVFSKFPEAKKYEVSFACYVKDDPGKIELKVVEAFHWDEDEEFFLVPSGVAKHYDLSVKSYTAELLQQELIRLENPEISNYVAYACYKTKVGKGGNIASLNSPLWGTGYLAQEKILYFYHGDQPEPAP